MTRRFIVTTVLLLIVVFGLLLLVASGRRAHRPVAFSGTTNGLRITAGEVRVPLHDVQGIEVAGCRLTLAGVRGGATPDGAIRLDPTASLEPAPDQLLLLELDDGRNMNVKGEPSGVEIEPLRSIHGSSVEWRFDSKRSINLFAAAVTVQNGPSVLWHGADLKGPAG